MKTHPIQWILAVVASVSASARPPQAPDERRPPPLPPLMAIFDTDRDTVLSAKEIQAASAILGQLDRNRDGEITLDELQMPPDGKKPRGENGPPPEGRPVPPLVKALDTDADGSLSAAELEGAPESLKTLDMDGDGAISPEELHPPGPPPHEDGPPPYGMPLPEDGPRAE
jgi:hypothetical protein